MKKFHKIKMKKQSILLTISFVVVFSLVALITSNSITNDENNPKIVIDNLYKAISLAKDNGNYKCCIEPACTMCYLGKWKYEKGTCFCDDEIAKGNFDDVCPECKNGIDGSNQCSESSDNLKEDFCKVTTN
ncbi:hypothetical protein GOV12_05260 [Candidatus Pacearchaeota archaeon]|nr:hypothetical protein [Candidatus Pacearchaeota archaeon]